MDRSLNPLEQRQIVKLARALCDEADASTVELGFATPDELTPFDLLKEDEKAVYEKMAGRLYRRLMVSESVVVVIEKEGHRLA